MKRYSQHQIEALLDKFMDGQTNVEEEALLADYFRNGDVPAEWEDYRVMFNYFDCGMEGDLVPEQKPQPSLTRLMGRRWWGIGAAAAITAAIVGTAVLHQPSQSEAPEVATTTPVVKPNITPTDSTPSVETQDFASLHSRPTSTVETQHLASQTTKRKHSHSASHLQAENAKLVKENERLQRELQDLRRRAFIIDMEANGFKAVMGEDGHIVFIDMEQEIENELNQKLTNNIPEI
ncbi:MAG: hypothetical protein IKX44_04955 [Prevotella sp.]|nr:hypothetical protein [Prevotella sp.]